MNRRSFFSSVVAAATAVLIPWKPKPAQSVVRRTKVGMSEGFFYANYMPLVRPVHVHLEMSEDELWDRYFASYPNVPDLTPVNNCSDPHYFHDFRDKYHGCLMLKELDHEST